MRLTGEALIGMRSFRTVILSACVVLAAGFGTIVAASNGQPEGGDSLIDLLRHAEWTGVIILLMSIASVTIIAEQFLTIRRRTIVPAAEVEKARQMIERREFKEVIEYVRVRKSMFADVLTSSLRHGRHGFEAMHEAAEERSGAWTSRLFRRVEYLNIIGNLGPLMGLLGTVLGMMRAFLEMKATHGAYKPEDLAGGIGLALVNTFLGLAVAIVSLGFFGVCRNRVDMLTVSAHAAVLDVLEYFRPAPFAAAAGAHVGARPAGSSGAEASSAVTGVAGPAGPVNESTLGSRPVPDPT